MRRILLILLLLSLAIPARAQEPEPYQVYLPLVVRKPMATCKRTWKLIEPDAATNYALNPSAETTGNFTAQGGAVVTRSADYAKYGLRSYHLTTFGGGDGVSLTLSALPNLVHFVTVRARGRLPETWRWALGPHFRTPVLIEAVDADWNLWGAAFPAAEASGSTTLYLVQTGGGPSDFYVDGAQVEANAYWTTYIDGTQDGCEWNGAEHASSSSRSGQSRAGGRVRDFWEDYRFLVERAVGAGAATERLGVAEYAVLPGGELAGAKTEPREFTLVGRFMADSEEDLHANRQALLEVLGRTTYPPDGGGWQPVRLRYRGAEVQKQIAAHYAGGLEAELNVSYGPYQTEDESWITLRVWTERTSVRFMAPDPFWYEVGESAQLLDSFDDATVRIVTARLRDTGQWDDLGPPNAAGTYFAIRDIVEDETYVYVGGNFLNFDNIAAADYIVRYNKQTGAWSALGAGVDNIVEALVVGSDGTLYAGGQFHNAGGGAAWHIAQWDPMAEAWSAVGAGLNAGVYAFAVGLDGTIYVGGGFTDLQGGGLANANYIAAWDPIAASWSALATGFDNTVTSLAVRQDGVLFAGGYFLNAGAVPVVRIAQWDGTAWSALEANGLNNLCYALAIDSVGILYAGGAFTMAGGVTVNRVAQWSGTTWAALGTGMNGAVWALEVGPDNLLYAGGIFSQAGGIALANYMARWNGSAWAHLDMNLPGAPTSRAIMASAYQDPVIQLNYDLFVGFDTTGTGYFAGSAAATNDGTAEVYPAIVFERDGGISATIESVRNETIGKTLLFDYDLLDGERLTVDLAPTEKSITSNMFGSRMDAVLAGCDFGTFALQPGSNQVTCFVNEGGGIYGLITTAYMLWQDKYVSFD